MRCKAAALSRVHSRKWLLWAGEPKSVILAAVTTSNNRWPMTNYLNLTDDEWQLIQKILPVQSVAQSDRTIG